VAASRFTPSRIDGDLAEWAGQPVYDSPFLVYWDDGWDQTNDGRGALACGLGRGQPLHRRPRQR
jgi:hypothetical protein